jgi:hypothetical protein
MKRKLTILSLAIMTAMAVMAWTASMGQAVKDAGTKFTAASYPTVATGTQEATDDRFVVTGTTLRCADNATKFEATLSEANTSLTVTPHYTSCLAGGFVTVNVDLNGCDYTFTAGKHNLAAGDFDGVVHINCPGTNRIAVTGGNCVTHVGPQAATGKVTYLNKGGNKVTIEVAVTVATEHTNLGFPCTFSNGKGTGTYTSSVLVECFKDTGNSADPGTANTNLYTHKNEAVNCDVGTSA